MVPPLLAASRFLTGNREVELKPNPFSLLLPTFQWFSVFPLCNSKIVTFLTSQKLHISSGILCLISLILVPKVLLFSWNKFFLLPFFQSVHFFSTFPRSHHFSHNCWNFCRELLWITKCSFCHLKFVKCIFLHLPFPLNFYPSCSLSFLLWP